MDGEFMEEGWLMGEGRWLSGEAVLQLQVRARWMVFRVDMRHNAASVSVPLYSDLAAGEVVLQLHLRDGQWWWKWGQCGPLSPSPHACRCGNLYLYILLYLFICLANQLTVTFPSWRCSFFVSS